MSNYIVKLNDITDFTIFEDASIRDQLFILKQNYKISKKNYEIKSIKNLDYIFKSLERLILLEENIKIILDS